jgi:hypothetical protein
VAQQVARRVEAIERKVRERWLAGTAVAASGMVPLRIETVTGTAAPSSAHDAEEVTSAPSGNRKRRQLTRDRSGNWQLPSAVTQPVTDDDEPSTPTSKRGTKPRRRTL